MKFGNAYILVNWKSPEDLMISSTGDVSVVQSAPRLAAVTVSSFQLPNRQGVAFSVDI